MRENKHLRIFFAIGCILLCVLYLFPLIFRILTAIELINYSVNSIMLYITIGVSIIGFILSIMTFLTIGDAVKEFKKHSPIIYVLSIINVLSIILCLITFKLHYVALISSLLVALSTLFLINEVRINEKFLIGQIIANKLQMEHINDLKSKEKLIEAQMKTEENEVAFGKTSSPLTPAQRQAQQLNEITLLFESGMMDVNEYRRLKDKILNNTQI